MNSENTNISSQSLTLNQRIIALYDAGMNSAAQIFHRLSRNAKVTLRTIERKVNLLKQGLPLEDRKRKEKVQFLTPEIRREIELYLEQNPYSNASDIKNHLGYDVSIRTIQRCLKTIGFKFSPTLKKPLISENHTVKRIAFARQHMNRRWDNVIFVDECTFMTHSSPKMAYQKKGNRIGGTR